MLKTKQLMDQHSDNMAQLRLTAGVVVAGAISK